MGGGSLTRYHTPVITNQGGNGLAEDLIELAEPAIIRAAQDGLRDVREGTSAEEALGRSGRALVTNLKRKVPSLAWEMGKRGAKRKAVGTYKTAV